MEVKRRLRSTATRPMRTRDRKEEQQEEPPQRQQHPPKQQPKQLRQRRAEVAVASVTSVTVNVVRQNGSSTTPVPWTSDHSLSACSTWKAMYVFLTFASSYKFFVFRSIARPNPSSNANRSRSLSDRFRVIRRKASASVQEVVFFVQ